MRKVSSRPNWDAYVHEGPMICLCCSCLSASVRRTGTRIRVPRSWQDDDWWTITVPRTRGHRRRRVNRDAACKKNAAQFFVVRADERRDRVGPSRVTTVARTDRMSRFLLESPAAILTEYYVASFIQRLLLDVRLFGEFRRQNLARPDRLRSSFSRRIRLWRPRLLFRDGYTDKAKRVGRHQIKPTISFLFVGCVFDVLRSLSITLYMNTRNPKFSSSSHCCVHDTDRRQIIISIRIIWHAF